MITTIIYSVNDEIKHCSGLHFDEAMRKVKDEFNLPVHQKAGRLLASQLVKKANEKGVTILRIIVGAKTTYVNNSITLNN